MSSELQRLLSGQPSGWPVSMPSGGNCLNEPASPGLIVSDQASQERPAKPPQGALASGLVSFITREPSDVVFIDKFHARLGRMSTSIRTSARLHCDSFGNDRNKYRCMMWTLTYKPQVSWEPGHIKAFLQHARKWSHGKNADFRYCWVAELTQKGAVHYHILLWVPIWLRVPMPDKKGWWIHGMSNTKTVHAPVKYAIKYTSKGTSDIEHFPKGARCFGVGGLDAIERSERMWWAMPRYVREIASIDDQPRRRKGGGFICHGTGEVIESRWLFVSCGSGGVKIRPKGVHEYATSEHNRVAALSQARP